MAERKKEIGWEIIQSDRSPAVYVIQKLLHFLVLCSNFLLFKEGVEARLVGVGERGL